MNAERACTAGDPARHHPSNCSDATWALIEPLIPTRKPQGPKTSTTTRSIFDAIRFASLTGCSLDELPRGFPPRPTLVRYVWNWTRYGTIDAIERVLADEAVCDELRFLKLVRANVPRLHRLARKGRHHRPGSSRRATHRNLANDVSKQRHAIDRAQPTP